MKIIFYALLVLSSALVWLSASRQQYIRGFADGINVEWRKICSANTEYDICPASCGGCIISKAAQGK